MKRTSILCKAIIPIMAFIVPQTVHAQSDALGSWDVANFVYTPNSKWSFFFETQTRSQKLTKDFYYHEFKGGVGYSFPKKISLLVGMGDYKTYFPEGNFAPPLSAKEFRLWEQLVLNNNIDRLKIEHRYRIEQRWINGDFRNRFRYRLNPVLPINHSSVISNTFYLTAFDEVFFTDKAPYFERNRFFAGAGYEFTQLFTLQIGWVRQYDYRKIDDGTGKNFLQTSLLFSFDKNTLKRDRIPSNLD